MMDRLFMLKSDSLVQVVQIVDARMDIASTSFRSARL